jgi:hypothetical protein
MRLIRPGGDSSFEHTLLHDKLVDAPLGVFNGRGSSRLSDSDSGASRIEDAN